MSEKEIELYHKMVSEHTASVYRYFCRWRFSASEAEDLTQEAYLQAWKSLPTFRREASEKAWLLKICRRLAWRHTQRRSRKHEVPHEDEAALARAFAEQDSHQPHEQHAEIQVVIKVLSLLNENQREVLHLHYLQELTEREVAEVLSISQHTVHSRLRAARKKFRETYHKMTQEPA